MSSEISDVDFTEIPTSTASPPVPTDSGAGGREYKIPQTLSFTNC
jgi:hypothetical protein